MHNVLYFIYVFIFYLQKVLELIKAAHLRPNLITYGVLALGCKTKEEAISLLEEMAEAKYRLVL